MSADLDLDMGNLLISLVFVNRFSASPKPRAQGSSPCTPAKKSARFARILPIFAYYLFTIHSSLKNPADFEVKDCINRSYY